MQIRTPIVLLCIGIITPVLLMMVIHPASSVLVTVNEIEKGLKTVGADSCVKFIQYGGEDLKLYNAAFV